MTLPREQWTPILNALGEQIGWDTGSDKLKWSTHEIFLQAEGIMQLALKAKARQGLQPKQVHQGKGRKKSEVTPKQRGGRR